MGKAGALPGDGEQGAFRQQDVDLDEIYEKFDVDFDLISLLMKQEKDENGVLRIKWGEQKIS